MRPRRIPMTDAYNDARDCGRFARSLAAETFERRDLIPMRDHDEIMALWSERPGFMAGYREEAA